jgi:hypothetical protein
MRQRTNKEASREATTRTGSDLSDAQSGATFTAGVARGGNRVSARKNTHAEGPQLISQGEIVRTDEKVTGRCAI